MQMCKYMLSCLLPEGRRISILTQECQKKPSAIRSVSLWPKISLFKQNSATSTWLPRDTQGTKCPLAAVVSMFTAGKGSLSLLGHPVGASGCLWLAVCAVFSHFYYSDSYECVSQLSKARKSVKCSGTAKFSKDWELYFRYICLYRTLWLRREEKLARLGLKNWIWIWEEKLKRNP